jgi:hypothetical protein
MKKVKEKKFQERQFLDFVFYPQIYKFFKQKFSDFLG